MGALSLYRRAYGEHFEVKPRQWWRPSNHRDARKMAAILDARAPAVRAEIEQLVKDRLIFGESYIGPDGQRIDPRSVR